MMKREVKLGVDLHHQILRFFEQRMADHSAVLACTRIENNNDFLYQVSRNNNMLPLVVHLSDAYFYGVHDFLSRPALLKRGDFVLVARPEANYGDDVTEMAKPLGIGIGQIGKFMGAINRPSCWEYITPDERKRKFERDAETRK